MENIFRKVNTSALFETGDLDKRVSRHLVNVYLCLSGTVAIAAGAAFLNILPHWFSFLGALAFTMAIASTRHSLDFTARLGLLLGEGFFMGSSLGPLVNLFLAVAPQILAVAFLGTVAVFGCFSLSAFYARRRSSFYLQGVLSSGLTLLLLMPLVRFIFGPGLFGPELYFGLLLFCGFVVFDTQLIIERAFSGNYDVIGHALSLFLDFVNIFVRVLVILARNAKDSKKSNTKRR
ncbi:bax inhibitor 1 [Pelomyxa schiedti]|nr:bax inhibitor 1 [Pelomyxa schiedti]